MIFLESLRQDLRLSFHAMRKAPMVTSIAVLSLALGIGANVAIFTMFDALLLRSLPVKDPHQIVTVSTFPKNASGGAGRDNFSFPMLEQFRRRSSAAVVGFSLLDGERVFARGRADYARTEAVTGNYYAVLGVRPVLGRGISETDDRESAAPVCVLSYRFWQTRFGGDRGIVGQRIIVGEAPATVVGVEPREYAGLIPGYGEDLWVPIHSIVQIEPHLASAGIFEDPNQLGVNLVARAPDGGTARLATELNAIFHQSAAPDQQNREVVLGPPGSGDGTLGENFRQPLLVLMTAVGLLLLIACANLANLLLARAKTRERETAVRLALGATRSRLIRQLLTESISLAALGAALGLLIAYWASSVLAAFNGWTLDIRPEAHVLTFTAALASFTGILFGLAPAIQTTRASLQPALESRPNASRSGLANMLIVTQFGFSIVALVGAGLYVRTLHNLRDIDFGIDVQNLSMFRVYPRRSGYRSRESAAEFAQRVLDRLLKVSGVESVALSRSIPLLDSWRSAAIEASGISYGVTMPNVHMNQVTAGFFQTMGIPVVLGRGLVDGDGARAIRAAVVNQTLARSYFPAMSPIGRHFRETNHEYEIVGVVRDARVVAGRKALDAAPPPIFFTSDPQADAFDGFAVELRARNGAPSIAADIRRSIAEVDPGVPLRDLETAGQTIDRLTSRERLLAGLSTVIGALAVLLAAIGLYGVRAYAVAQRTSEIGIRVALGADRRMIAGMILRETGQLTLFGVSIGLAMAYGMARYIQSMLYGVAAHDAATFTAAAVLMIGVATVAGYLPARRAARVDPMVALRHD